MRAGESLPLAGRKQRALLALLLLKANRVVTRETAVEALWHAPPKTADKIVRMYASRLQKLLGPQLLEAAESGYVLHAAPETVDAARFEQLLGQANVVAPSESALLLRDALALWRGRALGDIAGEDFARGEAVRQVADAFPDGVYVVSLGSIADAALVLPTIAQALGVPPLGRSASAALRLHLRERSLLLVLDSFEHVMLAAPELTDLLAGAPEVKLLVTSTAVLHVYSERELVVPPLELPDPSADHDPNALLDVPSVALFVHRAEAVNAEFALDPASAPAVAEICRRLDGLPLAIELAAARTKLLPPPAMLERLGRRLDLLGGGTRDAPARHQALRTTIDWSYGLLDDDEQRLFARLGVFAGGCTLEAADAVCGNRPTLLDEIASLLDKSLLRSSGEEPRLSMLETIREYAVERLEASGAADELRRRHAAYYVALAERAEPELTGAQQARWYERLEIEHDNLRAALTYALATHRTSLALRLSAALARFWQVRGYAGEGRRWLLESLAEENDDTPSWLRAKALVRAGVLSLRNGHYREARPFLEESAELYGRLSDPGGLALATVMLGQVTMIEGDGARALSLFERAANSYRELDDKRGVAVALNDVGCARLFLGDAAGAARDCAEAAALSAEQGDFQGAAGTLQNVAYALLELGREAEAVAKIRESVEISREVGYKENLAIALLAFAAVAERRGQSEVAARLLAASDAQCDAIGAMLDPCDRGIHDRIASSVSRALGEDCFADVWADGRSLEPEEALAYALAAVSSTG